ncbi:MAG: serine/threonine protein kinase [Woeseia sp.]|nr:serine/threonine protein kinase [Woeseia sp.]
MPETDNKLLKKDLFGRVSLVRLDGSARIVRDTSAAPLVTRWIARRLLAREGRALAAAEGMEGVPELLHCGRDRLERRFIDGKPMHLADSPSADYFRKAQRLLRVLHKNNIVHNDLAKEPNLLVTAEGQPAFIDFQLAWFAPQRGRLFRLLGREDLRHLLKHKRTYCAGELTKRELHILANPSVASRLWMSTGKRAYLFITRRLLGWADREGAGDRQSSRH